MAKAKVNMSVPHKILADKERIRMVLQFLLSQANLRTLKGYIEVGCEIFKELGIDQISNMRQLVIKLYIKDTGLYKE